MQIKIHYLIALLISFQGVYTHPIKALFLGGGGGSTDHSHNGRIHHHKLIPHFLRAGIDMTYTADKDVLNPETLAKYEVVLLYLGSDNSKPERVKALVSFVENGGGIVGIHHTSGAFKGDPSFVKLLGGEFKKHGSGQVQAKHIHGQENHPALGGISEFIAWDETFSHKNLNPDRTDLQTRNENGLDEAWTWVRNQGKGRVFYTAHGHDGRVWEKLQFQKMITAATVWASNRSSIKDSEIPVFTYREDVHNHLHNHEERIGNQRIQNQISPHESAKCIVLEKGFEAELIAHEPDIVNPIDITWDDRGRMYVLETVQYPTIPKGKGNDRIKLCEDTDADGILDKFTVFAEGFKLNTSICWVNGGIILAQAPDMFFLKDTDGDNRADVIEKINTGWGIGDLHGGPSNLKYSFDNKIYGCVGGGGHWSDETGRFSAGIWRMDADGSNFTPISNLGDNSWGLGISEDFEIFASTANKAPAKHVFAPYPYFESVGLRKVPAKSIYDYWTYYPLTITRQGDHFGGYTAGSNFDLYTARSFPKEYWNKAAFIGGPTGKLLGQFFLRPDDKGSYIAANGESLAASFDEYTAPIKGITGPDGNVYMLDWNNLIMLHGGEIQNPLRDKSHGRIYRITHKDGLPNKVLDLSKADTKELVETFSNKNLFWRMMAQQKIVQQKRMDAIPYLIELAQSKELVDSDSNPSVIHALWSLQGLGQLEGSNLEALEVAHSALKHPSAAVRKNAVRVLPLSEKTTQLLLEMLNERDANTLRHILLALSAMPSSEKAGNKLYALKEEIKDKDTLKVCYNLAFVRHGSSMVSEFIAGLPNRDRSKEGEKSSKKTKVKNLIVNPSFENLKDGQPDKWILKKHRNHPEIFVDSSVARSGEHSVRVSSSTGGGAEVLRIVNLEPGQYFYSGWVKTKDFSSKERGVYLRVAGRDVEEATSEIITDSRDEWQKLKVNFRVKAKSGVLLFALFGGWTDATGTVWYDDMELIQLSSEKVVEKEKPIESLLAEQAFGKSSEDLIQIFSLLNTKLEEKAQVYMQGLENIQNLQFNSEQINRLRKLAEDAAPKNKLAIAAFASNNGLDLGLSRYHNQIQGFEAVILEGEISNGKKLSKSCIVCHGEDFSGYESERAPSLAQFSDWYLQSQLQKFKHGIRGGDVNDSDGYAMKVLMQNYSFQQIADLSAYINSLEPKNMVTTLVGDAKKGADLFKNCVSCHQADGLGNKDLQAPKLAGLSDFYILKQLNNFKGGIRGNGNGDKYGKLMQIYANLLKDEQSMKDLAVYLTGLKPQISSSK